MRFARTTSNAASKIVRKGFRTTEVFFAEDLSAGKLFRRMAAAARNRGNYTVIQFDVPKSMSGMFQRGFIGEFSGAPFIDIGTGHELLLGGAANVLIFNTAILTQIIRVKRWRSTVGGEFDEY